MPQALARVGSVPMVLIMIATVLVVFATSVMLVRSAEKFRVTSFSGLVGAVAGTYWKKVFDLFMFIQLLLVTPIFVNIVGNLGERNFSQWFGEHWATSYQGCALLLVIPVGFPIVLSTRTFADTLFISVISLTTMVILMLYVAIAPWVETGAVVYSPPLWASNNEEQQHSSYFLQAAVSVCFAILVQYAVVESWVFMKPAAKPHFPLAVGLALAFNAFACLFMAFLGYVAFGDRGKANICDNFPKFSMAAQTVQTLVVLHELFYIPINFFVTQLYFLSLFNIHPTQLSTRSYILTASLLFLPPAIAMSFVPPKDVLGAFSYLVDATGAVGAFVIILPVLLYVAAFKKDVCNSYGTLASCVFYVLFGITVMAGGLYAVTVLFLQACNSEGGCSSY